jgi:uncharacterized protein YkwD
LFYNDFVSARLKIESKFMRILFLFILLFSSNCFAQTPLEKQTFDMINHQRKLNNLNYLKWNEKLAKAAKNHSIWMAKVGRMEHTRGQSPKSFEDFKKSENHPVDRIIKSGYYSIDKIYNIKYSPTGVSVNTVSNVDDYWGEIIAHGRPGADKSYPYRADIAVGGWMRSPGHKAQILKPSFQEMGVSITPNSRGEVFWCVAFGKRD